MCVAEDGHYATRDERRECSCTAEAFNGRDIDAALAAIHEDVVWGNGLDGAHVIGHAGVRSYWTRQWAAIDSHAEPTGFSVSADGTIEVEVYLTGGDLDGNLLFDRLGRHTFSMVDGRVIRFDIR
jgi:ketosteroid isomerase-like protein